MLSSHDLRMGKLALGRGLLTPEDLGRASEQAALTGAGLLEALMQLEILDAAAIRAIARDAAKSAAGARPEHSTPRDPSVAFLVSRGGDAPGAASTDRITEPPAPARPASPAQPATADAPTPAHGKYEVWGEIAHGGMGRIYLAYDREINRKVAMKVLIDDAASSSVRIKRFIEEIQATGQLEHPSIVPIYDMGALADGLPFFTMRYVRGRTLEEILEDLRDGHDRTGEYGRVRLLSMFHQICMAMHFAHEKGVIHRDLKPANVMIGSYGEVQIMDWGLAKVRGRQDLHEGGAAVDLASPAEHPATLVGQVIGTPVFMSPEQAAGNAWDVEPASDIYSLGAILYALLTYEPPFAGRSTERILEQVKAGDFIPPRTRAPAREIPEILQEICLRAMARDPRDRFADARTLAAEITSYLEGHRERERNHALAERHHAEGIRLAVRYTSLRLSLEDLQEKEREARRSVKDWWPFEKRRHVWEARARLREARDEAAVTFTAATDQLYRALRYEQGHERARAVLADLYLEKFHEAEAHGDKADLIMYRNLVERYHDGRYQRLLAGDGKLDLTSNPSHAEVFLTPWVQEGPLLVLGDERHLGATPMLDRTLPMGSYSLRLVARGCRDTILPVFITRASSMNVKVSLLADRDMPDGFIHVPGGPVSLGGDPDAQSPRDRFTSDRPDFLMGRYPVTVAEYRAFISDLARTGRAAEALGRVPRESSEQGAFWRLNSNHEVELAEGADAAALEFVWGERYPISCVSWEDAMAYCAWLSARLSVNALLPHDEDWEKAARGADSRNFPWGDEHDYTFANNAHSREGGGRLEPVGTFPMDRSPYGICDMAGNVRELCRNSPAPNYPQAAVIRGGGYTSPSLDVRAAGRAMVLKKDVRRLVGFRVAIYPLGWPADAAVEIASGAEGRG